MVWRSRAVIYPLCAALSVQVMPSSAQEIELHVLGNAVEAMIVTIDGEITPGIAERVDAFLRQNKNAYQVALNSTGGSLLAGIELGYVLRKHGIHTSVGRIERRVNEFGLEEDIVLVGHCASACATAFLGGEVRDVHSAEHLGFHQFYSGGQQAARTADSREELHATAISDAQIMSGILVQYIVEMGVDARVFTAATQSGPVELTYINEAQAIKYNVVTPGGFGNWFIEPYRHGIVAASKRIGPTSAYDQVHQTTFFCNERRPGVATVMLTADGNEGYADRIREQNPDVTGTLWITADAKTEEILIPSERVNVRGSSNDIWIDFHIRVPEILALLDATEFSLRLDIGRTTGGFHVVHFLEEKDRAMARSAFTHCIKN